MFQAIVFSKDRACQLEFFLRTFKSSVTNPCNIKVLYTGSNSAFEDGYEKVKKKYQDVSFIKQGNFKQDVLRLVDKNISLTVFFVDDNVFIRPWNEQDGKIKYLIANDNVLCLSLRLDPKYDFCYAMNRKQKIPTFDKDYCWTHVGAECDWGYPMSLDGHVFRTCDLYPLLERLDYTNPNTLESTLANNPLKRPKMICYSQAKIINNPVNKVQTFNNNLNGQKYPVTANSLNKLFLEGQIIDVRSIKDIDQFIGVHQEFPLLMTKE